MHQAIPDESIGNLEIFHRQGESADVLGPPWPGMFLFNDDLSQSEFIRRLLDILRQLLAFRRKSSRVIDFLRKVIKQPVSHSPDNYLLLSP